jgi:hypothetical protein
MRNPTNIYLPRGLQDPAPVNKSRPGMVILSMDDMKKPLQTLAGAA